MFLNIANVLREISTNFGEEIFEIVWHMLKIYRRGSFNKRWQKDTFMFFWWLSMWPQIFLCFLRISKLKLMFQLSILWNHSSIKALLLKFKILVILRVLGICLLMLSNCTKIEVFHYLKESLMENFIFCAE